MKPSLRTIAVLVSAACAAGGCAAFDRPASDAEQAFDSAAASPPAAANASRGPASKSAQQWPQTQQSPAPQSGDRTATNASGSATPAAAKLAGGPAGPEFTAPSSSPADPKALGDVLAELAAMGAIEPQAQQQLIEDLRTTDPELWPGVVDTFRASLAYRRRAAERAKAAASVDPLADSTAVTAPANAPDPARPALDARLAARATPATNGPTLPADTVAAAVPTPPPVEPAGSAASTAQPVSHLSSTTTIAPATSWQQQLGPAIVELEKQTRAPPGDADAVARHVWLRMLYLAVGRREDALKPIPGIAPAQQDYWSKQIFALATYLDSQRTGDPNIRAAEAVQHLTRAASSLAQQAPMVVRNLAFCSAVESYGVHKRIEQHEFTPGQELLVYAEVENFKSNETAEGFHTALQPSYQVLDSQGQRVAHEELPLTEEFCGNRRRDYFVRYFLTLPKTIYDGTYMLELTIEDTLARKIGQAKIEFTIKQKK